MSETNKFNYGHAGNGFVRSEGVKNPARNAPKETEPETPPRRPESDETVSTIPERKPFFAPKEERQKKKAQRKQPREKEEAMSPKEKTRAYSEDQSRKSNNKKSFRMVSVVLIVTAALLVVYALFFMRVRQIDVVFPNENITAAEQTESVSGAVEEAASESENEPSPDYSEDEIISECGISIGNRILAVDEQQVNYRLTRALPYIQRVSVKKSVFGNVTLTVTLTKGVFTVTGGNTCIAFDSNGKILEISSSDGSRNTIEVLGVTPDLSKCDVGEKINLGNESVFRIISSIYDSTSRVGIENLSSIDVSDVYYIQVLTRDDVKIIIGDTNNLDRKIALASKVLDRERAAGVPQPCTIDLTIDGKAFFSKGTGEDEQQTEEISEEELSNVSEEIGEAVEESAAYDAA